MTRRLEDIPNYRFVVMGLFSACATTGGMFTFTLGLLLPSISADLNLSPSQQGLLSSSAFWGGLGLGVPMTWWVSRYRVKRLTMVAFALGALFFFIQGWAPVFAVLLAGRLLFGISRLAAQPAKALLTTQWFAVREVVLATTYDNALFGLIYGVGFVATPFLLKSLGNDWRTTFNIYGAVFAALALLWMLLGRERVTAEYRRREVPRESGLLRGALMHRDLWIGGLGFMGPTMAMGAFFSFFPTLMLESYGVSLKWSGVLLALTHAIGGASGLGLGYFVFVTGKRNGLLGAIGLLMAGTYIGMTLTGSLPLLLVLALTNGTAWGYWPTLATVPYQLPGIRPREVAVANTFMFTMSSAGFVVGPLTAGFLQDALGDLQLTLTIVSFTALFVTVAGLSLRSPLPAGAEAGVLDA